MLHQTSRFATDAPITSSAASSAVGGTGEATTTNAASQQAYLARVEEDQNKRLDTEVEALFNSFRDIVKVASFTEAVRVPGVEHGDKIVTKDKYRNSLDGYIAELRAANIARSCESLLTLTHDLKTTLLLNDTKTLMQYSKARRRVLNERTERIRRQVLALNDAVAEAVWEMESVLGGGGSINNIAGENMAGDTTTA